MNDYLKKKFRNYERRFLKNLINKICLMTISAVGLPALIVVVLLFTASFIITGFVDDVSHYNDFITDDSYASSKLVDKYQSLADGTVKNSEEEPFKLPWGILGAIDKIHNDSLNSIAEDITDNLKPIFTYRDFTLNTTVIVEEDGEEKSRTTSQRVEKHLIRADTYEGVYNLKYRIEVEKSVRHSTKIVKVKSKDSNGQEIEKEKKVDVETTTLKEMVVPDGQNFKQDYIRLDKYLKKINVIEDRPIIMAIAMEIMEPSSTLYEYDGGPVGGDLISIPIEFINIYKAAANKYGIDWYILAAIHKIETDFSQVLEVSSAGAVGPMQFMPQTWSGWSNPNAGPNEYDTDPERIARYGGYGEDGNDDGIADPYNLTDAVFGTAHMIAANGYMQDGEEAIFVYNHSWGYVNSVLAVRDRIKFLYGQEYDGKTLVEIVNSVLSNPNISLSSNAKKDLKSGVIDARIIRIMDKLGQKYSYYVPVLRTGHTQKVKGTNRESLHFTGRGLDISMVNGVSVFKQQNAGSDAYKMCEDILSIPDIDIYEVGSPWTFNSPIKTFTNADHKDHIHVGVK